MLGEREQDEKMALEAGDERRVPVDPVGLQVQEERR